MKITLNIFLSFLIKEKRFRAEILYLLLLF